MKSQITTQIVLDTRRQKKDGTYPLKIRVTFERVQKYYSIAGPDKASLSLTQDDYQRIFGSRPRGEFRDTREDLEAGLARVKQIIASMPVFTFSELEEKLIGKRHEPKQAPQVEQVFQKLIEEMTKEDRLSTAEGYRACLSLLRQRSTDLKFAEITPLFLKEWHKELSNAGKSVSTIGIYMRYLRAVFNEAIATNLVDRALYPFGREKGKYQISSSVNVKKSLTIVQVQQIVDYQPLNSDEGKARDFWVLCYLCNGINPKDLAQIKIGDIDLRSNKLSFYRSKTTNRAKNMGRVEVSLLPEALEIIRRWGKIEGDKEEFVFSVFDKKMNARQQKMAKDQWLLSLNRNTKRIGSKLGFDIDLTTIVARHTFATVLMRSGVSQDFIRESLGHTDTRTTANYLGSFEDDAKEENTKLLLKFD